MACLFQPSAGNWGVQLLGIREKYILLTGCKSCYWFSLHRFHLGLVGSLEVSQGLVTPSAAGEWAVGWSRNVAAQ